MNLKVTWFILFAFMTRILNWNCFLFFGFLETSCSSHRILWFTSRATKLPTQCRSSPELTHWLSSTLSVVNILWGWRNFLLCARTPASVGTFLPQNTLHSNLYKTTTLGTTQKRLFWTVGPFIKHLGKTTTNSHCEFFINNKDLLGKWFAISCVLVPLLKIKNVLQLLLVLHIHH